MSCKSCATKSGGHKAPAVAVVSKATSTPQTLVVSPTPSRISQPQLGTATVASKSQAVASTSAKSKQLGAKIVCGRNLSSVPGVGAEAAVEIETCMGKYVLPDWAVAITPPDNACVNAGTPFTPTFGVTITKSDSVSFCWMVVYTVRNLTNENITVYPHIVLRDGETPLNGTGFACPLEGVKLAPLAVSAPITCCNCLELESCPAGDISVTVVSLAPTGLPDEPPFSGEHNSQCACIIEPQGSCVDDRCFCLYQEATNCAVVDPVSLPWATVNMSVSPANAANNFCYNPDTPCGPVRLCAADFGEGNEISFQVQASVECLPTTLCAELCVCYKLTLVQSTDTTCPDTMEEVPECKQRVYDAKACAEVKTPVAEYTCPTTCCHSTICICKTSKVDKRCFCCVRSRGFWFDSQLAPEYYDNVIWYFSPNGGVTDASDWSITPLQFKNDSFPQNGSLYNLMAQYFAALLNLHWLSKTANCPVSADTLECIEDAYKIIQKYLFNTQTCVYGNLNGIQLFNCILAVEPQIKLTDQESEVLECVEKFNNAEGDANTNLTHCDEDSLPTPPGYSCIGPQIHYDVGFSLSSNSDDCDMCLSFSVSGGCPNTVYNYSICYGTYVNALFECNQDLAPITGELNVLGQLPLGKLCIPFPPPGTDPEPTHIQITITYGENNTLVGEPEVCRIPDPEAIDGPVRVRDTFTITCGTQPNCEACSAYDVVFDESAYTGVDEDDLTALKAIFQKIRAGSADCLGWVLLAEGELELLINFGLKFYLNFTANSCDCCGLKLTVKNQFELISGRDPCLLSLNTAVPSDCGDFVSEQSSTTIDTVKFESCDNCPEVRLSKPVVTVSKIVQITPEKPRARTIRTMRGSHYTKH